MHCKQCNYPDSRVIETRHDDDLKQIYRRRECIKCGGRFTTQEHYRENYKKAPYKTQSPNHVLPK